MAALSRLYFWNKPQHIEDGASITIRPATPDGWVKWSITLPLRVLQGIGCLALTAADTAYSVVSMSKSRFEDLHATVCAHYSKGYAIHRMHLPRAHFHLISSPRILTAVAQASRWDKNGLFLDTDEKQLIFFPLLKDLIGAIDREEFLFTCHQPHVARFRDPILAFARNSAMLRTEIQEVIQATLVELEQREIDGVVKCSAQEITSTFTVAVISKLLLGRSPSFAENQVIANAISVCLRHSLMTYLWGKAGKELQASYQEALTVLRETVRVAQGPFLDSLHKAKMNKREIQAMFYLMFFAGAENSASLLQYTLWQMGQNKDYQTEAFEELMQINPAQQGNIQLSSTKVKNAFNECIRLHPPVSFFGRHPRCDLEIHVANKAHPSWSYRIPKGHTLACSPYLAARNEHVYPNPNTFNPNRGNISGLSAKPFGSGTHMCPGNRFAEEEIRSFTEALIRRYEISSSPNELKQEGFVLLHLEPSIELTLKRRAPMDEVKF